MEVYFYEYYLSTDKAKIQLKVVHKFLSKDSYWAKNIPVELVKKSIENSLTFGLYFGKKQVGFARIISDYSTFAYLADVFVLSEHRGKGLSKFMMENIKSHPDLQGLRRWMLMTSDAHELYRKFGFENLPKPENCMAISCISEYPITKIEF